MILYDVNYYYTNDGGICLRFVMSLVRTTVRSRLLEKISPAKTHLIKAHSPAKHINIISPVIFGLKCKNTSILLVLKIFCVGDFYPYMITFLILILLVLGKKIYGICYVRCADLRSSLLNVRQAPWSLMFYNVCQGLPMFANVNQCFQRFTTAHRHSLMFTNVRQCFPLFSNVHQGSHWSSHWQVLPRCLNVFFFFFFVFFFTQCHISLSHFYGHNRFWERGAIFQSESKKISQVTRWSLHLRSHHTSIVVWKKNTVIVGRTFSGQISLKKMCEIAFHQLLARKFEKL